MYVHAREEKGMGGPLVQLATRLAGVQRFAGAVAWEGQHVVGKVVENAECHL